MCVCVCLVVVWLMEVWLVVVWLIVVWLVVVWLWLYDTSHWSWWLSWLLKISVD